MSFFGSSEPSEPTPQTSTVVAEPATPEACQADYESRSNLTDIHPSSYEAKPHTYGRRQ